MKGNFMSFEDYVSDVLNLHIALLSECEIAEIRESFKKINKTAKALVSVKHPDLKMKLADLKEKVVRLLASQERNASKYSDKYDVSLSTEVIKLGNELLKVKATKASLVSIIELNSAASRALNNQINK